MLILDLDFEMLRFLLCVDTELNREHIKVQTHPVYERRAKGRKKDCVHSITNLTFSSPS